MVQPWMSLGRSPGRPLSAWLLRTETSAKLAGPEPPGSSLTVTLVVIAASLWLFDFSVAGLAEQVTVGAVVSVVVVLSSTETVSERTLAVARSGFWSPLR